MSNKKKFLALELWIEEAELNKDGLNNLELLIQNWAEQAEFTDEELQEEEEILKLIFKIVDTIKIINPQLKTIDILIIMIEALRNSVK